MRGPKFLGRIFLGEKNHLRSMVEPLGPCNIPAKTSILEELMVFLLKV